MNASEIWSGACRVLEVLVPQDAYQRWIAGVKPIDFAEGRLLLGASDEFAAGWLRDHYLEKISEALRQIPDAPSVSSVEFCAVPSEDVSEPDSSPTPAPKAATVVPKRRSVFPSTPLDPQFTFENFVTGPSNSFAHGAALGVAQSPGRAFNPLFIYGDTGIGKTHLMQAIGHQIIKNWNYTVRYVSSETLLNEYVDSLRNNATNAFREKYRKADVLMVDDVQFFAGKNALQEEFFHTFNELSAARKQIIMTSDLPPKELKGLEPRLVSRFECGLVTQIECPDFETRWAILRYKQSSCQFKVDDELLTFIADNITSNVRSLEGALNRVVTFMSLSPGTVLTVGSLRSLLKDQIDQERSNNLTCKEILEKVAVFYKISYEDIIGPERPKNIAQARQVAMFLCRKLTSNSLPQIGKAFSRTHATVLHALTTVQNRLQTEQDFRNEMQSVMRQFGCDTDVMSLLR